MSHYIAWAPSLGQAAEDGVAIVRPNEPIDASDAAAIFASEHAGFDGDPFQQIEVYVQQTPGEWAPRRFIVDVEVCPAFLPREVLQGAPL